MTYRNRSNTYRQIHNLLNPVLRLEQFNVIELPKSGFEIHMTYIPNNIDVPNSINGENIYVKKVKNL